MLIRAVVVSVILLKRNLLPLPQEEAREVEEEEQRKLITIPLKKKKEQDLNPKRARLNHLLALQLNLNVKVKSLKNLLVNQNLKKVLRREEVVEDLEDQVLIRKVVLRRVVPLRRVEEVILLLRVRRVENLFLEAVLRLLVALRMLRRVHLLKLLQLEVVEMMDLNLRRLKNPRDEKVKDCLIKKYYI